MIAVALTYLSLPPIGLIGEIAVWILMFLALAFGFQLQENCDLKKKVKK